MATRQALCSIEPPSISLFRDSHNLLVEIMDAQIEAYDFWLDKSRHSQWDRPYQRYGKLITEYDQYMDLLNELTTLSQPYRPEAGPCPREHVGAWESLSRRIVAELGRTGEDANVPSDLLVQTAASRLNLIRSLQVPPCLQTAHGLFVEAVADFSLSLEAIARGDTGLGKELGRRAAVKVAASADELARVKAYMR